ncbi:ABC transporter substrate-binding protein [Virgibacillus sp. NKC19-3]|uniref:ABC transporter substrate-binding protein n=1 Tax=Virgibacillus saliphilus TaxID=2831674 RepID=UPI001C9B91E5|nr:ABC transporter substrate-binding protein [Virgibacillus sp. NKC19-3]MBY7142307.1 ABC transporter substrate-binding protein [Virgibacillus sp. NKC19-3]
MKHFYRISMILLSFIMAFVAVGCSSSNGNEEGTTSNEENGTENKADTASDEDFPTTVENAGRDLIFDEPPERVVALYQQEAELMVALGLEHKLVGYSIVAENTPPEYEEKLEDVPVLAENSYPSKEVLLGVDPDFVIGSERTFTDNGAGTVEEFDDLNIAAYVTESEKPETIENMVYKEIKEIAQIFGVEERGEKLIRSMQEEMDEITSQIGDVDEPVKVLLMSGGDAGSAQVSGGYALDNYLIELAGGENIFADEDKYLFEVNWEEIIDRDPDVIVTSYCCGTGPEDLEKMIAGNASLEDVTAVENDNYVAAQVEDTTGNVRVIQGLETLAEGFYPELFDEE